MPYSHNGTRGTVLVVDDNKLVRELVVTFLERASFRVLSADCGESAIKLARETGETINLLLSDADMENMSGPDLGEILKKDRPCLHVMLMSGGIAGNLLILNYGWAFIQKPFVAAKLVEMITEVLESEDRSQPGGHEFDSRKDTRSSKSSAARAQAGSHLPDTNEPKDRRTA
jgi:DNA-binding NtrC family response regulator